MSSLGPNRLEILTRREEERAAREVTVTLTVDEIDCLGMMVHIAGLTDDAQRCYPRRTRVASKVMERLNAMEKTNE